MRIWQARVTLQKGVWAKLENLAQSCGQQRIEDVIVVGAKRLIGSFESRRAGAEFSFIPRSGDAANVRVLVEVDNTSSAPAEESNDEWSELEARVFLLPWKEGMALRRTQKRLNLSLEQLVIAAAAGLSDLKIKPGQGFELREFDEDEILRLGGSLGP